MPESLPPFKVIYQAAYFQYRAGAWEAALSLFRLLVTSAPLESLFWFGLGACLQQSRQFENSLKAWTMSALLNPENPYAYFHAAECCLSTGQLREAGKLLSQALTCVGTAHLLAANIECLQTQHGLKKFL
jgi:tetratricopeptide (TPR) repeat protein